MSELTSEQCRAFMSEALSLAHYASERGEVPVGAVIVSDNKIVSSAHNRVEELNDASAHAEMLCIKAASEKLKRWRLEGCSLFVTMEPCPMCMGALLLSRVDAVYFGCYDPVMGAAGSVFNLADHSNLPGKVKLYPELLNKESEELVKFFFAAQRSKKNS